MAATVCKAWGYTPSTKRFNVDCEEEFCKTEVDTLPNPSMKLDMPPKGIHPPTFIAQHFGPSAVTPLRMNFAKGTTTLSFIYKGKTKQDKGGVIVAVDSRASSGQYVSSKSVMKAIRINDGMIATMAGGAADCQFWCRVLSKNCGLYELQHGHPISVAAASKVLSNMLHRYKGMGLSIGTMVAGFDKTGPCIYYVDNDGSRVKGDMFSIGSGCLYAIGVLDTNIKPEMTDAEARALGRKAIVHATFRDAGSGGVNNLFHITPGEDGSGKTVELGSADVSDLYYEHMKKMGREPYNPII